MRADSKFASGKDLNEFMLNVSQSSYEYNHSNIRTNSHKNFIKDLMSSGFIYLAKTPFEEAIEEGLKILAKENRTGEEEWVRFPSGIIVFRKNINGEYEYYDTHC